MGCAASTANAPVIAEEHAVNKGARAAGAHRYWRILCTESADSGWEAYFRTLEFYAKGSREPLSGFTPIAHPENEASIGNAKNAFDGNHNTSWRTRSNPGKCREWIGIDAGRSVEIANVKWTQWGGAGNHMKRLEIQFSDDKENWGVAWVVEDCPVSEYDSRIARLEAGVVAGTDSENFNPEDFGLVASEYAQEGLKLSVVGDEYSPNIGSGDFGKYKVRIEGQRLVVIIDVKTSLAEFCPSNAKTMAQFVQNIEKLMEEYDKVCGWTPKESPGHEGKHTIECVIIPAAGLAVHGWQKVAIGPAFWKETYEEIAKGDKTFIHQIFWYELGRNWLPSPLVSDNFNYATTDDNRSNHWLNQALVNIFGCLISDHAGLGFRYNWTMYRAEFRKFMEDKLDVYMGDEKWTWENTCAKWLLPWEERSSLDNLYSGMLSRLYEEHGGYEWMYRFLHCLPEVSKIGEGRERNDPESARELWVLACSIAARSDLSDWFSGPFKWPPVSEGTRQKIAEMKDLDL
uniref:F5/8 type C domain-containing protein n=1 Tax=Chromera velia CCMP2878 TaxID=1169474 RepID=A0A0G4IFJ7_9ALVE|mmetsp:Transcript_6381/g.12675  ORF Transcript_6381/g.12675 Transcript_6381/m.12675 type:complete len:515 (+) Transcript_6381:222-1766(+)|eukprot:Cvel_2458.t1-p1 / transcript=Cvel_2458.t1 / gene=Cvel_2458 / organism=Chromera_velia_CCMP2878 / gene_product=hypothetical protein / transcript_product=hypothetical protein / location=Cvel_scaffold96:111257-114643(-) / protein_length=514 / sequence_SO=supercontig / SO=protein_coding / is_pseudo=false